MPAQTVTFTVQIGSDGFEIARIVALSLGFTYYDWEITSRAAKEAKALPEAVAAAEHLPSLLQRIMERMSLAGMDDVIPLGAEARAQSMGSAIQALTSSDYRRFIESVVREIRGQGKAVIVGHASQVVLRDDPGVLKVLIHGSAARRAQRFAKEAGLDQVAALAAVRQSDKERLNFFKQIYHVDMLAAPLYDLTLNTDSLSVAAAAEVVASATKNLAVPSIA